MKIAAGLLALTLSLAACAADETDAATDEVGSEVTTDTESSEAESSETEAEGESAESEDGNSAGSADQTDEAMEDEEEATEDDSTEAGSDGGSDGDGANGDGTNGGTDNSTDSSTPGQSPGLLLTALLAQAGLEPTDEILGCIEDRGVDLEISSTADEQAVQEATLVLFTCAPDELAEILADETEPPAGTTTDDVECVIAETFRYLGSLPTDEAIAALEQDDMPQEVQDEVVPIIENNCGLTEEQANAIFES